MGESVRVVADVFGTGNGAGESGCIHVADCRAPMVGGPYAAAGVVETDAHEAVV